MFVKPVGAACNLNCDYCYYLEKSRLYPGAGAFCMPGVILEEYIVQHIEASSEPVIRFSWHGGEPTLAGVDFFRKAVDFQRKNRPKEKDIFNGMQTNGTLLDEAWCRFLAAGDFHVGLSLDGPRHFHNRFRRDRRGKPSFDDTLRGFHLLEDHGVKTDILCVVNARNVRQPLEVFRFFKRLGARYVSFLPLVEPEPGRPEGVSPRSVPPGGFGDFLCAIFDEWLEQDIGKIKIQIFEEATRTAFGQDHSLCVFRETCGEIPVVEHNGDFYCCDHYVDADHHLGNIIETPLAELIGSPAQRSFGRAKRDTLPRYCRECDVLDMCHGGCPKNRFSTTPHGEPGLNYLCEGYRSFFTHCRPFVQEVARVWKDR